MSYIKGGMLLWQDSKTSVAITGLDGSSKNGKTGPMAQSFILKRNTPPTYDVKGAGCKGCPVFEGCYVRWEQAPRQVYKSIKGKRYKVYNGGWEDNAVLDGIALRVGAAGEPSEMPARKWTELLSMVKTWTGYTHKWKAAGNLPYRAFCMASVHSVPEMEQANRMGYRTYRVGGEPITKDEVMCPYYTHDVQCIDCGLCKGSSIKAKNIYAPAHGARKNKIK